MKFIIKKKNSINTIKSTSKVILLLFVFCFTGLIFQSCVKDKPVKPIHIDPNRQRNVLLIYAAGNNSLSSYIKKNIATLTSDDSYIPSDKSYEDVLLVYSKITKGSYRNRINSHIIRYTRNSRGELKSDTLKTYPYKYAAATAETMNDVLTFVKDEFPNCKYGMVFSSHSTGWLPNGFFSNPDAYNYSTKYKILNGELPYITTQSNITTQAELAAHKTIKDKVNKQVVYENFVYNTTPYKEKENDGFPLTKNTETKSVGQEYIYIDGTKYSVEIELKDFAEAIPMYLDYIIFDSCLMGAIEVAYELKDKCGQIAFSPTEVLADGFNYNIMGEKLIHRKKPDLEYICKAFYEQYAIQSGDYRSATVTLVDCSKLNEIANAYAEIIKDYKSNIDNVDYSKVQKYFYSSSKHWNYDMYDIVEQADIPEKNLEPLKKAIDNCIIYKAHTPSFFNLKIDRYSGLSMYLPADGKRFLDIEYKKTAWNKEVGLVK